jgi:pimeloyl-ACP methyl ester carboxylesterase
MNLNFDAAVEDVASTMRATTTPPATVIAHDWGCVVTYRLQRKHPELVRRVAVLDVGNDVDGLTPARSRPSCVGISRGIGRTSPSIPTSKTTRSSSPPCGPSARSRNRSS